MRFFFPGCFLLQNHCQTDSVSIPRIKKSKPAARRCICVLSIMTTCGKENATMSSGYPDVTLEITLNFDANVSFLLKTLFCLQQNNVTFVNEVYVIYQV